jgi:hypothetical protein
MALGLCLTSRCSWPPVAQRRERRLVESGLTADQVPGFADPQVGEAPWDDSLI